MSCGPIFRGIVQNAYSSIVGIRAGLPLGTILSPVFYNIYFSGQSMTPNTLMADNADEVIISTLVDLLIVSNNMQNHFSPMEHWYRNWRFKVNQNKLTHTTFVFKLVQCPYVFFYGTQILSSPIVKYLELIYPNLTWAYHIKAKRLQLNFRLRIFKMLIAYNKHSKLNIKLLIYKSLLKPIWTSGLQL